MTRNAKTRILEAGARLVHRNGFNDTGLQEILEAAQVPKGSFYYYFKSKEDLGLHLVGFFADILKAQRDSFYQNKDLSPIERIRAFFKWQAKSFRKNGFIGGCPLGNLALEMGGGSHKFRKKLNQAFAEMKNELIDHLEQARKQGEIPESIDLDDTADFIIGSWEGALMQMKVSRNTKPHEVFDRMVFGRLLAG